MEFQENEKIGDWIIENQIIIGITNYGKILRCYLQTQPSTYYCVKIIEKKYFSEFDNELKKINENVISVFQKLVNIKSENIIQIKQVIDNPIQFYIFMELCDYDLQKEFDHIQPNWFSRDDQLEMIKQITNGACTLKESNIILKNIRPKNILIKVIKKNEKKLKIYKIADFGLSCILKENCFNQQNLQSNYFQKNANITFIRNWNYLAPEIYYQQQFSELCDIYSYGLIFYQIVFQEKLPFQEGPDQIKFFQQIETLNFKCKNIPGKYGNQIENLLKRMIVYSSVDRINFEELQQQQILKDPYQIDQNTIFDNLRLTEYQIQNQIQLNFKTKFDRIYKLLNIYHHKYLLCENVRNQLKSKYNLQDLHILIIMQYIGLIGFTQIKYAYSLIKMIHSDMEDLLIKQNDLTSLMSILNLYREESKQSKNYKDLNQIITQLYHKLTNNLILDYGVILMKNFGKQNIMLKDQIKILQKSRTQKLDFQIIYDKLGVLTKIQLDSNQNPLQQIDIEQINRVVHLQEDFGIQDYLSIELDKISRK